MNPLLWLIGGKSVGDWLKWIGLGLLALIPVVGYMLGRSHGSSNARGLEQQRINEAGQEARNVEDQVRRTDGAALRNELRRTARPG